MAVLVVRALANCAGHRGFVVDELFIFVFEVGAGLRLRVHDVCRVPTHTAFTTHSRHTSRVSTATYKQTRINPADYNKGHTAAHLMPPPHYSQDS